MEHIGVTVHFLMALFSEYGRHIAAAFIAIIGAALGFIYRHYNSDGGGSMPVNRTMLLIESATCGFLVFCLSLFLEWMDIDSKAGFAIGGALSFLGTRMLSNIIEEVYRKRMGV